MKSIILALAIILMPAAVSIPPPPDCRIPVIQRKVPLPGKLVITERPGIISIKYYSREVPE